MSKWSCCIFLVDSIPLLTLRWHCLIRFGKTSDGVPKEAINHSADAVAVSQYTASFFVNQARRNFHQFPTPQEEDAALIENYPPTKTTGSFMEEFFFANDF